MDMGARKHVSAHHDASTPKDASSHKHVGTRKKLSTRKNASTPKDASDPKNVRTRKRVRPRKDFSTVFSRAPLGLHAPLVRVEVHLGSGLPAFAMVGLPETVVRES
jgi:hypothetical protein